MPSVVCRFWKYAQLRFSLSYKLKNLLICSISWFCFLCSFRLSLICRVVRFISKQQRLTSQFPSFPIQSVLILKSIDFRYNFTPLFYKFICSYVPTVLDLSLLFLILQRCPNYFSCFLTIFPIIVYSISILAFMVFLKYLISSYLTVCLFKEYF